jgi:hypothetical protein
MTDISHVSTDRGRPRAARSCVTPACAPAPPLVPRFPTVIRTKGRKGDPMFVLRSELNNYKAELLALALGAPPVYPPPPDPDPLVPFPRVAEELGIHRRTLGRRLREGEKAAEAEKVAEASRAAAAKRAAEPAV